RGTVGGKHAERVGAKHRAEIGDALGHRRTDEGIDVQAALEHGAAKIDAVDDVGGKYKDVRLGGADLLENGRPVGGVRVVDDVGHDLDSFALRLCGDGGGHRCRIPVNVMDDGHAQSPGRQVQARRPHLPGE